MCNTIFIYYFKPGKNTVRLEYRNRIGAWTYGYEIFKNDEIMYQGSCGQVWLLGCEWDISRGVVHTFEFEVDSP